MSISDARKQGEQGEQSVAEVVVKGTWVEGLARFGYLVRGALYLLVGILAVQVAIGARNSVEGKEGALSEVSMQPFGKIVLIIMVIGLAGYSLWGLVRAVLDPLKKGKSIKGIAERAGYVVSGVSYGILIIPAVNLIWGGGREEENAEEGTAFLLAQPLGHWLLLVIGVVAMGGALGQAWTGISARFKKDFKQTEMSEHELAISIFAGRLGHIARAVVFGMIGFFLVQAAWQSDAGETQGLDGSLTALAEGDKGGVGLMIVAVGLMAFGVYSILCTRWIRLVKVDGSR